MHLRGKWLAYVHMGRCGIRERRISFPGWLRHFHRPVIKLLQSNPIPRTIQYSTVRLARWRWTQSVCAQYMNRQWSTRKVEVRTRVCSRCLALWHGYQSKVSRKDYENSCIWRGWTRSEQRGRCVGGNVVCKGWTPIWIMRILSTTWWGRGTGSRWRMVSRKRIPTMARSRG